MHPARDDRDAAAVGELPQQQPQQQEVGEVVDRERRLVALRGRVAAVAVLDAGVGDDGVQRRQPGGVERGGEGAHRVEVGEVEREGDVAGAAAERARRRRAARAVARRDDDRPLRQSGQFAGAGTSEPGGRTRDDDRPLHARRSQIGGGESMQISRSGSSGLALRNMCGRSLL